MFTFKLPRKDGFCVCKPVASETRSPNGVSTLSSFSSVFDAAFS